MGEVELRGVRKAFGSVEAVRSVDLDIAKSEFCVLLGPSGCGKSTLLRMIAGLEDVTSGTISIAGRDVTDLEPHARDVAMVFQSYALYPHMTVAENMGFALRLAKRPKPEIDTAVREAARLLSLEELLARYPRELSGGQRQRVAMGRAIVRNPTVFLFDEPLSNLDAKLRVQMRLEIARLHARLGNTAIYVTHDQVEAMTMADRIVIMRDGRIEQAGAPMEVYERPANAFVATFIGTPPINLLPGVLRVRDGARRVEGPGYDVALSGTPAAREGPVKLGVRPEHVLLGAAAPSGTMTVSLIEPLGRETIVYGRLGEAEIAAVTSGGNAPKLGERIPIGIAADAVHVFDDATGARL